MRIAGEIALISPERDAVKAEAHFERALSPQIKRELRRRAAIEPVIGHLKAEHRMGRNYLAHRTGDAVSAVLAAAGYNFHLLLRWLELLLSGFLAAQKAAAATFPEDMFRNEGRARSGDPIIRASGPRTA